MRMGDEIEVFCLFLYNLICTGSMNCFMVPPCSKKNLRQFLPYPTLIFSWRNKLQVVNIYKGVYWLCISNVSLCFMVPSVFTVLISLIMSPVGSHFKWIAAFALITLILERTARGHGGKNIWLVIGLFSFFFAPSTDRKEDSDYCIDLIRSPILRCVSGGGGEHIAEEVTKAV